MLGLGLWAQVRPIKGFKLKHGFRFRDWIHICMLRPTQMDMDQGKTISVPLKALLKWYFCKQLGLGFTFNFHAHRMDSHKGMIMRCGFCTKWRWSYDGGFFFIILTVFCDFLFQAKRNFSATLWKVDLELGVRHPFPQYCTREQNHILLWKMFLCAKQWKLKQ